MVHQPECVLAEMRGPVQRRAGLSPPGLGRGAEEAQDGVEGGADGTQDTRGLKGRSERFVESLTVFHDN